MDMDYVKMWLKSLIKEEINKDQLKSVATALNVPNDQLRSWVISTDPTPNQAFSVWILRGLKKQWVRMEDSPRITAVLKRFIELRNAGKINDIMVFPQIHDLETELDKLAGQGAKRQGFAGVDPETLPGVTKMESDSKLPVTFYKVTNPKSAAQMGEGTKWCTRISFKGDYSTAASYMSRTGALIIGYKDGRPFVQMNPDKSQIMDVNDRNFRYSGFKIQGNKINISKPQPPEEYKMSLSGDEPASITAYKAWGKMTGVPTPIPGMGPEFWPKFEKKLADAIRKVKSYGGMLRLMEGWRKMYDDVNRRTPEVEKAIIEKDWRGFNWRYFGGGGPMKHIPGMYEIIEYVKHIIHGPWPEFEKQIQNDFYNTIYYFARTGFNTENISNPLAKETIELIRMVKANDTEIKTPEFKERFKKYILDAKGRLDRVTVSLLRDYLILPYLKANKTTLKRVLGTDYRSDKFYRWGVLPTNPGAPQFFEPDPDDIN